MHISTPTKKNFLSWEPTNPRCFYRSLSAEKKDALCQTLSICRVLSEKQGVHSTIAMQSAGFHYTGSGDTVRCDSCELEVSNWTLNMKPFTIHAQGRSDCPYVRSSLPIECGITASTLTLLATTSAFDDDGKPHKCQKTDVTQEVCQSNILIEINLIKEIRKRTFSHWPHRTSPSSAQMTVAGFFACNTGDRVICIYCNIICQEWTPQSDDPWEIHKTLSPKCPYVIAILKRQQMASTGNSIDPFQCNEIVHTAYIEISRRHASFATWSNENLPSVDDLVRAGFFYTGTSTTVTCFYCNGSLQTWRANNNPTIEHVRWFPHCAYAKQLRSAEMYQKIQDSKRTQQECPELYNQRIISRLAKNRLDLPISKSLVAQGFKLLVIKRCYKDQLRLKHNDFVDDCDLLMACIILQKQIDLIDGKKENIIIPSAAMKKIRERKQTEHSTDATSLSNSSIVADVEIPTLPDESSQSNLRVVCLTEQKRLT